MAFEHELPAATDSSGDGLFQQGHAALHHAHPVASNLDHGAVVVEAHQLGLLRQQHARGWQFQACQDLLPEFSKILGRLWVGCR